MKPYKFKYLSMLLIVAILLMPSTQLVWAQSSTDTHVTGENIIAIGQLDYNIIQKTDEHLIIEISAPNSIKIVLDYQLNVDQREGILNLSNYLGENLVGKQEPIVISTDEQKINAEQFINDFYQTTSNLTNRISDNEDAEIMALPVLLVPYTAAALSALYSFIVANWSTIAIAGIATAGVYNADSLYEYLRTKLFNIEIAYILTSSAVKHMSGATINNIVKRNNSPIQIYYGPSTDKFLLVFNIPNGLTGAVHDYLNKTGAPYTYPSYNLTGYKLLVLFNPGNKQLYHAHLRYSNYANQDIEYMRYHNKLTMRLLPTPVQTNNQYLQQNPIPSLSDNQLKK
mgnify:CR=1 FL=1|jgi:hypothetical protein